ncbi:hypothetical protein MKEN_00224600 [Mycena kentingensis (nom. inval.)]|nr:hypothetical protein MKEN_00224600 [Mycena kentingensis (nom. inval.)]
MAVHGPSPPGVEEDLWSLLAIDNNEGLDFFKAQTGIVKPEEIEDHIVAIQKRAYEASLSFRNLHPPAELAAGPSVQLHPHFQLHEMCHLPAYREAVQTLIEREDGMFLDVGCFFGTDVRKLVSDGIAPEKIIVCDIVREFWDMGHELFKSTPSSFPIMFHQGDILDPAFLSAHQAKLTAIHISFVFHLFPEPTQRALAHRLASFLSPLPGSVIFGATIAKRPGAEAGADKFFRTSAERDQFNSGGAAAALALKEVFCHIPESWVRMWEDVFGGGRVKVDTRFTPTEDTHPAEMIPVGANGDDGVLEWSCTRHRI